MLTVFPFSLRGFALKIFPCTSPELPPKKYRGGGSS
jgi:hypothetical protein